MKVLVTGATGFIGSFLSEKLENKGYEVYCFVRTSSNLRWITDLNVNLRYGSLFDKQSIKNALTDIEMVFHLAGTTKALNQREYDRGNFEATVNLVDAILDLNRPLKRFIFVSSQAAYGPSPTPDPINEQSPKKPLTEYGRSKLKSQEYIKNKLVKIPRTVIIPPAVYGPRDTDVLKFFKTVKSGIIPQMDGKDRYASLVHVDDLIDAIILAAEREKALNQEYFIANPKPYSWSEIARITLNYLDKRAITVPVPGFIVDAIAGGAEIISKMTNKPNIISRQKVIEMKQDFWICSPKKALLELNFETKIELQQGIEQTIDWYVENNWL